MKESEIHRLQRRNGSSYVQQSHDKVAKQFIKKRSKKKKVQGEAGNSDNGVNNGGNHDARRVYFTSHWQTTPMRKYRIFLKDRAAGGGRCTAADLPGERVG
jgi:hypothetical protein